MKPPILLLHGAIGAAVQLEPLAKKLSAHYEVHRFDFPGHGGTVMPAKPFSIRLFCEATLEFIKSNRLENLSIFGYSMGGYVAMLLAKDNPQLIKKTATLATKFYWDEAVAAKETKLMNPETISLKVPAFAAVLEKLHAPGDWKEVLRRTATMLTAMGNDNPLKLPDYKTVSCPVLLMLGDNDKMVTLEETTAVYKNLSHAELAVIPGTPHPIEQVDISLLAEMIHSGFKRM